MRPENQSDLPESSALMYLFLAIILILTALNTIAGLVRSYNEMGPVMIITGYLLAVATPLWAGVLLASYF